MTQDLKAEGVHALSEVHGDQPLDLDRDLWDILASTASTYPDREALVSMWQPGAHTPCLRWTYRDLRAKAEEVVTALEEQGCRPGMHLTVVLWNCAEWCLLFWAAVKLGMTFVPVDPRATDDVLAQILEAARPTVLVAQDGKAAAALLGSDQADAVIRLHCSDDVVSGWTSLHSLSSSSSPRNKLVHGVTSGDDKSAPALIVFTSGTTGRPKGCLHTSRNLMSQTNAYDANADPAQVDRWLVHTPTSHILAINNALRAWRLGDAVVFPARTFSVASSAEALARERCTIMSATPTLVKALLMHGARGPGLSLVSLAGTMIGADDIRLCKEGGLGARDAIQAFGMSEGAPLISWSRQDEMLVDGYHPGVGKVLPGASMRICDPDSTAVLPRMQAGELHVGGPSVISGYLGGVESDEFYQDESGRTWLRTGDQAMMTEEGVVHVLGRYKDLIIRGGENINPLVIESVLNEFSGLDAQVVGVPDDMAGQVPVAVVKLLPEGTSKAHLVKKARLLGQRYALGGVYTLGELGIEDMPLTCLGKPKKAMLARLAAKYQRRQQRRRNRRHRRRSHYSDSDSPPGSADLEEVLLNAWEQITGVRPRRSDSVMYLADSITLLRFCDAVARAGRPVYLEDIQAADSVEKLASLLASRDAEAVADTGALGVRNDDDVEVEVEDGVWTAAREHARMLGGAVEEVVPIRHSLYRMVIGQRSHSYCIRIVFRVKDAPQEQVYQGLCRALASRSMLRTTPFRVRARAYHAVLRADEDLMAELIKSVEVRTRDDAQSLLDDDGAGWHPTTHTFRAVMLAVRESRELMLVLTYSHSVVDALSLLSWQRDLDDLIAGDTRLAPSTPYRLFADLFAQYQDSAPAHQSVLFHARRLRGISRYLQALWPPSKPSSKGISSRPPRRSRIVHLPALPKLRALIDPPTLMTCALALFNALQTRSPVAVFTSWESGRSWPFIPSWMRSRLPPASSIDGPTFQWVMNMLDIRAHESLTDFFQRMGEYREQVGRHVHFPWEKLVREMREEGDVLAQASFRQSFVWDVSVGMAAQGGGGDGRCLQAVARHDWPDGGFFWNAFMVDKTSLMFIASWDESLLPASEVDAHCDTLSHILRTLATEQNWDKQISQVFEI